MFSLPAMVTATETLLPAWSFQHPWTPASVHAWAIDPFSVGLLGSVSPWRSHAAEKQDVGLPSPGASRLCLLFLPSGSLAGRGVRGFSLQWKPFHLSMLLNFLLSASSAKAWLFRKQHAK